jgi:hypothetical protein
MMGIDACMLIKTRADITPEQLYEWTVDLKDAFDSPFGYSLGIIDEYRQDGPTILPARGETLIEVGMMGRYYGKGYERGDLLAIVGLADWLDRRIPQSEVWYGGDSVCMELFDAGARQELWEYFCTVGHKPYYA